MRSGTLSILTISSERQVRRTPCQRNKRTARSGDASSRSSGARSQCARGPGAQRSPSRSARPQPADDVLIIEITVKEKYPLQDSNKIDARLLML